MASCLPHALGVPARSFLAFLLLAVSPFLHAVAWPDAASFGSPACAASKGGSGTIKAYSDELCQLTAGANGSHRMKGALASVDEQVFYDRVAGWSPDRVESCHALLERTLDGEQRKWALIAIGHAGAKTDVARLQNLVASKKLTTKEEEAASIAIAVLEDRHR